MNKAPLITPKAKINYIDHLKVVLTVFLVIGPAAVIGSFLLGLILVRIPLVDKII